MAGQHTAVNTFPGLVHTARHTMRVCNTRSQQSNRKEDAAEGRADNWGEVVTRQPYRKVRLDHLLSKEKEKIFFIKVLLFIFQCTLIEIGNQKLEVEKTNTLTSNTNI